MLFLSPADYSMIKAFGCLAYAYLHSNDKFHPRAIQRVFVGYPHLTKGYKLLRLDTHAIFVSRHVKFIKSLFPYHQLSDTTTHFKTTTSANSYDFLNWLQQPSPSSQSDFSDLLQQSSPSQFSSSSQSIFSDSLCPTPHTSTSTSLDHQDNTIAPILDHSISLDNSQSTIVTRKSQREKGRPVWWTDYQVAQSNHVSNSNNVSVMNVTGHKFFQSDCIKFSI